MATGFEAALNLVELMTAPKVGEQRVMKPTQLAEPLPIGDLPWEPHPAGIGGERAWVEFPNGYGASCIRGGRYYTRDGTYEIAVMHNGKLTYDTPITDDVLGYQSEAEANAAIKAIAALPKVGA